MEPWLVLARVLVTSQVCDHDNAHASLISQFYDLPISGTWTRTTRRTTFCSWRRQHQHASWWRERETLPLSILSVPVPDTRGRPRSQAYNSYREKLAFPPSRSVKICRWLVLTAATRCKVGHVGPWRVVRRGGERMG